MFHNRILVRKKFIDIKDVIVIGKINIVAADKKR